MTTGETQGNAERGTRNEERYSDAEPGTGNGERARSTELPVLESEYAPLPCFPCPHASNCCSWGVTLSDEEAAALGARYGHEKMYKSRWGEWRTRVRLGKCVFLVDNACSIHADPNYPAVCRGFPYIDAETGGPYRFDQTICPEFEQRDDLHEVRRRCQPVPSAARDEQ